jgi:hypothetical protein
MQLATCGSTVRVVTTRCLAISRFEQPCAINATTSESRAVRSIVEPCAFEALLGAGAESSEMKSLLSAGDLAWPAANV